MVEPLRHIFARAVVLTACILACLPALAGAQTATDGGASPEDARYRPAKKAKIINGYAIAPKSAPRRVKMAIEAANEILDLLQGLNREQGKTIVITVSRSSAAHQA